MPAHDIDVRSVARTGAAIAVTIVLVIGAVLLLLRLWHVEPGADRLRLPYTLVIEGPTLQSAPQPELASERASKARTLATSGWVHGEDGIVHIPIATAMRLLAEAGSAPARVDAGVAGAPPAATATPAAATAASAARSLP